MTDEVLSKATKIKKEISEIDIFIYLAEGRRSLNLFNKPKKIGMTASDYMRTIEYYEASTEIREKIINLLKQEKERLEKEYETLV